MPPTVKTKQSKEPTQPPFQGIALSWHGETGFHPKNTKDPGSSKTGNQLYSQGLDSTKKYRGENHD
jgi:hypothetical protein